jgi:hypothetical protein
MSLFCSIFQCWFSILFSNGFLHLLVLFLAIFLSQLSMLFFNTFPQHHFSMPFFKIVNSLSFFDAQGLWHKKTGDKKLHWKSPLKNLKQCEKRALKNSIVVKWHKKAFQRGTEKKH